MPITFILRCQKVRPDNGHFTMFFDKDEELPAILTRLPKKYAKFVEGRNYLITIEPAPQDGRHP